MDLRVNGRTHRVNAEPDTPLLYVLRNDLGLKGARYGCGLEQCGACTVLVDGEPAYTCREPISAFASREIVTVEGLGSLEDPHPVQRAFLEENAAQCGYCTSGLVIAAAALLERCAEPSDSQIREALDGHLCRCGAHPRILRAVRRAGRGRTG